MKRKILYISGSRAEYGLMRSVLREIKKHPALELEIIVTGMHLMREFGLTVKDIEKDGYKFHRVYAVYERDDKKSMADFIGKFISLLTEKITEIDPDIILLVGDRGEMLAGAIVGAYLTIPVAHIHGGEVTSTVDEIARHAITKLSHIHFVATPLSARRVIQMGENPSNVFIVGAPSIDNILSGEFTQPRDIAKNYDLDLSRPIIIVVQHPVTTEIEDAERQMRETMEAISDIGEQTIVIYPNADAGGRRMIKVIERYRDKNFIRIYKSVPYMDFLGLMNVADVLVGNSSSGIIEAPSFGLPVVNIGKRQEGRERAENIIDVNHDRKEIKKAIEKALYDENFKRLVKSSRNKNPYGDGKAGVRIARILSEIDLSTNLLQKRFMEWNCPEIMQILGGRKNGRKI